jgi:hypothetical protein
MKCVHGIRVGKHCEACLTENGVGRIGPSYGVDQIVVAEALVWAFEQRPGWSAKVARAIRHTPQDLLDMVK